MSRIYLLAALLMSPAWSQEPAARSPVAPTFDLRSAAIKKIVRDTAATQFSYVRVSDNTPDDAEPDEVAYVPPVKPTAPAPEPPQRLPDPAPESDNFISLLFEIAFEELLGTDDYESDDVTFANDMLRCRVQKEVKSSPPGPDRCPDVD